MLIRIFAQKNTPSRTPFYRSVVLKGGSFFLTAAFRITATAHPALNFTSILEQQMINGIQ
jgi:hypothetical protein